MSKEPKINIIYSPKDQGLDRYFEIAKTANKGTVYVWFEGEQGVERMWVQITKGNNKNGGGVLISDPVKLTEISMGNYVMFKQTKTLKLLKLNTCLMAVSVVVVEILWTTANKKK